MSLRRSPRTCKSLEQRGACRHLHRRACAPYGGSMHGGPSKRGLLGVALATVLIATGLVVSVAATARPSDLCREIPTVNIQRNDLGFRAGWPTGARPGARGHGKVNL